MDNFNLISTNLINNNNINNFEEDSNIRKIQHNLIMMGFDILMVNKVISFFKIRTENEALDYLLKTEDGMWNHPFIPKEIINDENNNKILEQPKIMMNSVISKISNSVNPNIIQNDNRIDYKIEDDICEICGELKDFHKIKDYNINNDNNNIDNNNIFNNHNNLHNFNFINLNENNNIFINNNENNNNIERNNNRMNILIDEDEEDVKEEEINPDECPICMDKFENPVEIEKCKHKFCYDCFNSYLVNLINQNNIDKIPCPKNKCSNKELSEDFFSQYLSEQEYFKYRQFKSKNEIARDAKKFFCPYCDSYAQIEGNIENYDSNNPNYKKSILKCMNGHQFCSCGRPIHENECYHDEKEFEELIETEKIKKCPKCGFLIKKNRGCNHMTCGNPICKYEFCWLCMNEAVPGHYEFGPCAGKQFFDPDSFSYQLHVNHPFLSFFYEIFMFILGTILFILAFVAIPGIGLSFLSYGLIYDFDDLRNEIGNEIIKFFLFLICICICFCCQSIVYIAWALIAFVTTIIISSLIIGSLLTVISYIFRCIFCPDSIGNNSFNEIINNNENNEIEMANSINNDSNNN